MKDLWQKGPCNTALILAFLDRVYNIVIAALQMDQMPYIIVAWDKVCFHRSPLGQNWLHQHPQFTVQHLPQCPDVPHASHEGGLSHSIFATIKTLRF